MATSKERHARMIKSVAGGVVVDGVSAMHNLLEVLDALPIQAAHARERDGVVAVAPSEHACEMSIYAATTVRLRPDDEARLVRVLDDDCVKS